MTEALIVAGRILAGLLPPIVAAVQSGTAEAILTQSLAAALTAAAETARARVDARAGRPTSPLAVEAVRLADRVAALRALSRPDLARAVELVIDDLQRGARADESTARHDTSPPESQR